MLLKGCICDCCPRYVFGSELGGFQCGQDSRVWLRSCSIIIFSKEYDIFKHQEAKSRSLMQIGVFVI